MDKIDKSRRSENMRRIRSYDTTPELAVRKILRRLGLIGYRIHRQDIPGKPDIVWNKTKLAIFVHGCFWHGHSCKEGLRKPKSRTEYWISKIERNSSRDASQIADLNSKGWKVLVIWDCEIKDVQSLEKRLLEFYQSMASIQ